MKTVDLSLASIDLLSISEIGSLIDALSPIDISEEFFCSAHSDCPTLSSSFDHDFCCPKLLCCFFWRVNIGDIFETITAAFGGLGGFVLTLVLTMTAVIVIWYARRNPNAIQNSRKRLPGIPLRMPFRRNQHRFLGLWT